MAGWSKIADESVVDCIRRTQKLNNLEPKELLADLESLSKESKKIQYSFDQVLRSFLEEICALDSFWPLPPMLGDGQSVDLFKLFLTVREKGGYDAVSKNRLWHLVAEESGLGSISPSCIKLVYVKYLDAFERCLKKSLDDKKKSSCNLSDISLTLRRRLMEFGADLKGLLSSSKNGNKEKSHVEASEKCELNMEDDVNALKTDDVDEEKHINEARPLCIDLTKCFGQFEEVQKSSHGDMKGENIDLCLDEVAKATVNKLAESDGEDLLMLDSDVLEGQGKSTCRKRKKESMLKVLSWLTRLAKNPCHRGVSSLPDISKWNSYGREEPWKQVLLYRESVNLRRHVDSSCEQPIWQKNQKMLPCLYDDNVGGGSYNLRERLASNKKSCLEKTSSQPQTFFSGSRETENRGDKSLSPITDFPITESVFDLDIEKIIPVGPLFQAQVAEWTGVPCESDSKWLGTRVWPLEKGQNRTLIERERIGKGRQDSCGCPVPNSVECVRFHIAEKRYRLKLELANAFYSWKFDKMGEEVMLLWTEEEKKNFEAIVRLNPPSADKRFWNQIVKYFRGKSREALVSYFFNVFLLQRRAHQNRFTPDDIDSDDDIEMETGSTKDGSGHETMTVPGSIMHSPNKKHKKSR